MTSNLARYQRIAPFYDLLDLPFERRRYQALRPLMFENLGGQLLDAGIGTGRNCAFYPPDAIVSGIDTSPAMLARAHRRCPTVAAGGRLYQMDVTELDFRRLIRCGSRDFPVLRPAQRPPGAGAPRASSCRQPGGLIRLLEYVLPKGSIRRIMSRVWQPWIAWTYGASFDRHTEKRCRKPDLNW